MPSERRIEKINSMLAKEISEVIAREVKDPRLLSMATVLSAEISRDMKHAKVKVSLYSKDGNETENIKTLAALNNASGFISSVVSKNMRLRWAPQIVFERTDSIEKGMDIYYTLKDLADDDHIKDDNN